MRHGRGLFVDVPCVELHEDSIAGIIRDVQGL